LGVFKQTHALTSLIPNLVLTVKLYGQYIELHNLPTETLLKVRNRLKSYD